MADPQAFQLRCGEERLSALTSIWQKELKFDSTMAAPAYWWKMTSLKELWSLPC